MTHYLARRYLHFSWDEWDALPWWQARAYTERLNEELRARAGEGEGDLDEPEVLMAPHVNDRIVEAIQGDEDDDELPMARAHIEQMGAKVIEVQFGQQA